MPSPGDSMPIIRKGDPILASDIQRIADAAGRKSLLPGMMQTGAYTVQKRVRGGGGGGGDLGKAEVNVVVVKVTGGEIAAGSESSAGGPGLGTGYNIDADTGGYLPIDAEFLEQFFGVSPFSPVALIYNPFAYKVNERASDDEFSIFPAILFGYTDTGGCEAGYQATYLLTGNALLSFKGAETAGGIFYTPDAAGLEFDMEECPEEGS